MKLLNFSEFRPLDELREAMGAVLNTDYKSDRVWLDTELGELLRKAGVEVSAEDVEVVDDLLEYRGQRVLLYIRDQYQRDVGPRTQYKYHIAHCRTLERMWFEGRSKRYVVATRTDGVFLVVDEFRPSGRREEGERPLGVCLNCISLMKRRYLNEAQLWARFNLNEFFQRFGTEHTHMPVHADVTAPENRYAVNWAILSRNYRELVGWACERCGADCWARRDQLHVHHRDRVKSNNHPSNLEALCAECHRREAGHQGFPR